MWKWKLEDRDKPVVAALFALALSIIALPYLPSPQAQANKGAQNKAEKSPFFDVIAALGGIIVAVYAIRQYGEGKRSSERQLRAYVHPIGFSPIASVQDTANGQIVDGYVIRVPWQNFGQTPAKGVRIEVAINSFPATENHEPSFVRNFESPGRDTGPGGTGSGQQFLPINLLTGLWHRELEIFIWVRMEYFDAFRPNLLRQSELCARLDLIHDPRDVPPPGHPPYLMAETYGPLNVST